MIILMFSLSFILSLISGVCHKSSSRLFMGTGSLGNAVYLLFTGLIACTFFFVSNGCTINLNKTTVIFALIFAVVCIISLISGITVLRYIDIAKSSVISSSSHLILSSLLGILLFGETLGISAVIRIFLMLAAVFLIFISQKRDNRTNPRGTFRFNTDSILKYLSIVGMIAARVASTLVSKYYVMSGGGTDNNSYCFCTNVFIIFIALLWAAGGRCFAKNNADGSAEKGFAFASSNIKVLVIAFLITTLQTVVSNISSVLSLVMLARMDISFYTPITSALGILASAACSLIFRERLNVCSWLALCCCITALFL